MNLNRQAIRQTNYHFDGQTSFYRGKVRDVYRFGAVLVMVATDRISAFDVILPEPIPNKGLILNQIAALALKSTSDIVPNWLVGTPDPNVSVGHACEPFAVEMVVRGYLAGHAWREYQAGRRTICGVALAEGLQENQKLDTPIITPTTKAAQGHDQDISIMQIIKTGLVSAANMDQLQAYSLALFNRGTDLAAERGLILVDTKYEFGLHEDKVILIDEIHTPDSSRYFYAEGYQDRQDKNLPQKQLSKEFVRQWLIENGFQGLDGQSVPVMDENIVDHISQRYSELYYQLTGQTLDQNLDNTDNTNQILMDTRIKENIKLYLNQ